ncbi:MAG: zinc ribbon domain-containing protein [Elusimicrobia bacterium]|nr:zinc ribbon domain-containing protein [Elusimicrobiota bacterium]
MKCVSCGQDNKDAARACRKCGRDLAVPPAWFPDAAWHLKTLGIIYASLTVVYFGVTALLSTLPRPYHLRRIPLEMTPWLNPEAKSFLPEERLKAPPLPPEEAQAR